MHTGFFDHKVNRIIGYLSSEKRLLLYVARTSASKEVARGTKGIVHRELDWDYFVEMAKRGWITPLAYWNLRKTSMRDVVPDAVMERLRHDYCTTLCRNIVHFKELGDLLGVLKDDGIEVILLKGAALTKTGYPDEALRPMEDIDLVTENGGPTLHEVLYDLGYRSSCPIPSRWHLTWQEHLPGYSKQRGSVKIMFDGALLGLGRDQWDRSIRSY